MCRRLTRVCVCLTCGIGSIRNHHRSKNKGQWLTADAVTLNQECDCEIWRERGIFFTSATSCFFLSLLFFVRCLFYLFLRENDPVISGNCSLSALLASTSYLIDEFTQSLLQCVTVTLTEWLFNTISLLLLEYEQKLCVFFTLQTNPKFLFNYTHRHLKLLKKSFFYSRGINLVRLWHWIMPSTNSFMEQAMNLKPVQAEVRTDENQSISSDSYRPTIERSDDNNRLIESERFCFKWSGLTFGWN